jgi:hypothetical protein
MTEDEESDKYEMDCRPPRKDSSIQYTPPAWLKKKPDPPRDDA